MVVVVLFVALLLPINVKKLIETFFKGLKGKYRFLLVRIFLDQAYAEFLINSSPFSEHERI